MDASCHEAGGSGVNHPVAFQGANPGKLWRNDMHGKVGAIFCARMPGVMRAVIAQHELVGVQGERELLAQQLGELAHVCCALPLVCSQNTWASRNTNITPGRPKTFTSTQVASL